MTKLRRTAPQITRESALRLISTHALSLNQSCFTVGTHMVSLRHMLKYGFRKGYDLLRTLSGPHELLSLVATPSIVPEAHERGSTCLVCYSRHENYWLSLVTDQTVMMRCSGLTTTTNLFCTWSATGCRADRPFYTAPSPSGQ